MKIGIQLVGGANPPPAQALARRGLASSARGYPVFAHDTSRPAGEAIIQAVARGDIDIAIVWGPIAGYYAARQDVRLVLTPVAPEADGATLPMVFDIAMGVRIGNDAFRAKLNRALVELRPRIDCVLAEYNVPRVDSSRMAMPCSQ